MANGKIRVLHVTNSLSYGGLERVVIDICRHLNPAEFAPMVACTKRKGAQAKILEDAGIPVIELKKNQQSLVSKYISFFNLLRVIRDNRIQIIHTHNTGPLLETMLARLVSLSFPEIIHTDHTRAHWPDKKKYMAFEYIASKFVHSIIAVSVEAREKLVYYEHIREKKIDIVDNGVCVEQFHSQIQHAEEIKKELQIDHFKHFIGTCVVHRKQKGIQHLIHALPAIIKAFPGLVCVLGGDGQEREALGILASDMHLQEHIRFIGLRGDVERILPVFDVYVLPSEWEGLPLSLLEAMAAQRSIVASSVGAVPGVLEFGKCGVLVPPKDSSALADAVITLLNSPERRAVLAAEAYRCVCEKYDVKKMAQNYSEYYKRSLGLV